MSVTYFEPVVRAGRAFLTLSGSELEAWFDRQPEAWREKMAQYARIWGQGGVLDYVRRLGAPPCTCGYLGEPNAWHRAGEHLAHGPVPAPPARPSDDETLFPQDAEYDDDLPF